MTVKSKQDANPQEQIPDDMKEKRFKAMKGYKNIIIRRFLWGSDAKKMRKNRENAILVVSTLTQCYMKVYS